MKLIIDMPEETLREVNRCGLFLCPRDKERLINSIKHNTPIPDNATNGDMIKALFSETAEITGEFGVFFEDRWWNAPYKRGKTE